MLESTPDFLRLAAIPVFGWAAVRDINTRRVPTRTWYPLFAIALITLGWDSYLAYTSGNDLFFIQVVIGVGFMIPLTTAFWQMNSFGGADARALYIIALLFPVYPTYRLLGTVLPMYQGDTIGIFSLTILSNTVVAGSLYPLIIALSNIFRRRIGLPMVFGKLVRWDVVTNEYGILLQTPDGFVFRGLDLDALRMYLNWRDCSLAELRENAEQYRRPETLPEEPGEVGDGNIVSDGGIERSDSSNKDQTDHVTTDQSTGITVDDQWGAEAFLDAVDGAYGTTPEDLRDGLDVLVAEDEVWISPGIPFIVPMFAGLVMSLTYGDVLVSLLAAVGLG